MATSSITHNFIFTDPEVVERLAKILEESANDPPSPCTVKAKILEDPDEIRELMNKVKQANDQRKRMLNPQQSCAASATKLQADAARNDSEEE